MMVLAAQTAVGASISHDSLLLFIIQFALLLLLARTLGLLATRVGMPSVVGELTAGLLLGPTVFGALAPGLRDTVFNPSDPGQEHLLEIVSFLGVMLLLVLTGLETDIALILSRRSQALKVSLGGIVVPFATGFGLALVLPDSFVNDMSQQLTFALFLGTAMSISAIPVIAKVLIEMRIIRRDIGQLTLAAGMIDDTVGWILLSIVAGLAGSGTVSLAAAGTSVLTVIGFLVVAFTLGGVIVGKLIRWVSKVQPGEGPLLTTLIVLALIFAAVTQSLGIEAVLGAFVLGILAGRVRRVDHRIVHTLESITLAVFAPVFFASAGLKVDLRTLSQPRVILVAALVLLVAIGGKFIGAYLGATAAKLGRWEALSLGAGMNARGALEIIVATIGLNLGVLTPEMFTIIVMVAIVTSLMAPPLLRVLLPRVPMSEEEQARLDREEGERTSLLSGVHRVLLPTRGGTNSQLAAQLLQRLAHGRDLDVTVLHVTSDPDADQYRLDRVEAHLSRARVHRVARTGAADTAEAVIAEAAQGYDLLVVGATETLSDDDPDALLFSSVVDRVLMNSPCPVLVVHSRWAQDSDEELMEIPINRILLPTTGSDPQSRAPEIAFALATGAPARISEVAPKSADHIADAPEDPQSTPVDLIRIIENPAGTWSEAGRTNTVGADLLSRARLMGQEIVAAEAVMGTRMGAQVTTRVEVTDSAVGPTIIELAASTGASLIVVRSDVQPVTRRAFMGHDLDHVLRHSPCPVVVITGS
ncbi:MAG: cation:proton antiporter [Euzebya sp.]